MPGDGVADSSILSTASAATTAASPREPNTSTGTAGDESTADPPAAKKARVDPSQEGDQSRMEVDGEREISDAETVPDEQADDDDDDDDEDEEQEEEEEEEESSEEGEDGDRLEAKEAGGDSEDEALDDEDSD